MHKLTFWKKIGLSFIVLVAILILINHQLNKDTNTPNRLTLSNLFTVDVKKSHIPWITTADNNKQEALDVVNRKMASTIKNFISKEEKSGSYYSINHEIVYNTDQLFTLKLEKKKHMQIVTQRTFIIQSTNPQERVSLFLLILRIVTIKK